MWETTVNNFALMFLFGDPENPLRLKLISVVTFASHKKYKSAVEVTLILLRNSTYNLFVPRPFTEAGKNSFLNREAVLWNSLPGKVKGQTSLKSFLLHL